MQNDKIVILTGMMGSGKSSVSKELANLLECPFIDLDEQIEKKYEKISTIFEKYGEEYFRDLETKELMALQGKNFILSTGGGIVLRDKNVKLLKDLGRVFYLSAAPETIYQRIKNETHRPLLKTKEPMKTIKNIINERLNKYEQSGEKIITDNKTIAQIAGEIYEKLMR